LIPNPRFLVDLKLQVMSDHGDTSIEQDTGLINAIYSSSSIRIPNQFALYLPLLMVNLPALHPINLDYHFASYNVHLDHLEILIAF